MTTRARRSPSVGAKSSGEGTVDEGAERYIWVFPEENRLVLAIPGLRGLKFSVHEARTVGEMLIQAADEMTERHRNLGEGGDNRRPAGALGSDADRGVVLGAQMLDAIGVRRGPGGRSAVAVAYPAPPDHGVNRRHRVDADQLGDWETDGDGHGAGFLPERRVTSVCRTARKAAVRS